MKAARKKIDSADELMAMAAVANVLADAAERSLHDPLEALAILQDDLPSAMPDIRLEYLRMAVREMVVRHYVARNRKKSEFTEFDVHRHFWANLDKYLPEATRVKHQSIPRHIPDGWLELGGVVMPVEIKRDVFNAAAARQLLRYMTEYGVSRGVAVAREIRCPRDPRVIYIECDGFAV
ncbi:hypothetical protein LGM75_24920 [Burkholderia multivorans]|uniref:hypothetical protein n=1 Tax=Burkholderia multivorans TaxID=87883 RepID=UPI00158AD1D6|nr:hypothetical protein [Burkholderia multivorans]MBU9468663.1 hypothetical protein [Burkholderia multivorans]MCA8129600.1 hypothetical protein [Burkholderia multivorans]UXZ62523.1 hypothetical protein NUJ28_07355 [Burkholderia multivorans]